MSKIKRPDFVGNEIYGKHLARGERAMLGNYGRDIQSVYERFYYKRLSELAASRFKWTGLPVSVDPRFMETTLLRNALVVFFQDDSAATRNTVGDVGDAYFALLGNPHGSWNMTNNPTSFLVTGTNYPSKVIAARDCVPIWANYSRTPDIDVVQIYAHRLATLDRTIDINVANARRTRVVVADQNQQHTAANVNRQIEEGNPVIFMREGFQGLLDTVDLGVEPKTIEHLHILRVRLWNECMLMLGIQGANQDKKERLVEGEVEANSEQIDLNRETALNARRMACEQINRKYKMNVSVEFITQDAAYMPVDGA